MGVISDATVALVRGIAAEAQRVETPCGDGAMVWRSWGSGPPLVLLHGGYGSWTHWIRNVLPLARHFRVIAPDSPALGESATPPEPHTAESLAAIITAGLATVLPHGERVHIAGFSLGGVLGAHVAAELGDRVRGFTVVGSNGLGLVRSSTPLQRIPEGAPEAAVLAIHRYNLGQLMIADPDKVDELAVYLQSQNSPRARFRTRRLARSDALARALPEVTARLDGIWGERDATARPHLDERARILRSFQTKARFAVVPGAGHWVQYEAADRFNALIAEFAGG